MWDNTLRSQDILKNSLNKNLNFPYANVKWFA